MLEHRRDTLVVSSQAPGAKAMFYDPASGQQTSPAEPGQRWKPIKYADPFPQLGFVGIHYWFEDPNGTVFSEERAATVSGPLTLHVRANATGFLTAWVMDGIQSIDGAQLLSTEMLGEEYRARGKGDASADVQFLSGASPKTVIFVFARSNTEQANSPASARSRLHHLSARTGPGGAAEIVRESDGGTPGEVGTYVVNRRGMPLATEIILRSK